MAAKAGRPRTTTNVTAHGRLRGVRGGLFALAAATGVAAGAAAAPAMGAIIDDPSYFDSIPHTYIDFEARVNGTPITLPVGGTQAVPLSEYGPLGMGFSGAALSWVHDAGPDQMAAIAIGGSPDNSLRFFREHPMDPFGLLWIPAVRAVGFFVVMNNSVHAPPPTFSFYSQQGLVGEVTFAGSFVDGTIGVIDYGYIGFEAPSQVITAMLISTDFAWSMDDLSFSPVPAPTALPPLALAVPGMLGRSRRRA